METLEQLYRVESMMESLRIERAEIVKKLDEKLFPILHRRLGGQSIPKKPPASKRG